MIIEINEMIDCLEKFFDSSRKETVVGGIAGTQIERYVIDAATATTSFSKILVVNGCQDYIGMMKEPLPNVLFWADLFITDMIDPLIPYDPWKPKIYNPEAEYVQRVNTRLLSGYDVILIFNTHLIPSFALKAVSDNFSGQIVYVTDPLEYNGREISWRLGIDDFPVISDHLEKVSPMIALARSVFGFDTRAVDRKVKGTLTEANKIGKRSIGKIDDKQYVTNDYELLREIQQRQYDAPFRKNQKVVVNEDLIDVMLENGVRKASLTGNSMLVMQNPTSKPLMKLRLYNSKIIYAADVTYAKGVMKHKGTISVTPANIIDVSHLTHHRFNNVVFVLGDHTSKTEQYTVLKNSNNVIIVNRAK